MIRFKYTINLLILLIVFFFSKPISAQDKSTVYVGSKTFTESYILAEILAQKLESSHDIQVERKLGLGGTGILFSALQEGQIDLYVEYTGTIAQGILKEEKKLSNKEIQERLEKMGLTISKSLGFNNTYALAMLEKKANKLSIKNISDLKNHKNLEVAFTHEFVKREDGYKGLNKTYNIGFFNVQGIQHALAFEAIRTGKIEVTDIYSTDAKISSLNLRVLKDNKKFFPEYLAVVITRKDFATKNPNFWDTIRSLEGSINEETMVSLNALSEIEKLSFKDTAKRFFDNTSKENHTSIIEKVWKRTKEHIALVGIAILISLILGIPMGIIATSNKYLKQFILSISGLVQTIPSLALLCFLIPLFGIGTKPALVALILYGILPIVVNTYTGISSIESRYTETARSLGLTKFQKLTKIDLPLASPSIFAGIKTSTIINIGTATLAALIGAGGYGVPIMTGLALNNNNIILEGAIPAALLALMVSFTLDGFARFFIPRGLQ